MALGPNSKISKLILDGRFVLGKGVKRGREGKKRTKRMCFVLTTMVTIGMIPHLRVEVTHHPAGLVGQMPHGLCISLGVLL